MVRSTPRGQAQESGVAMAGTLLVLILVSISLALVAAALTLRLQAYDESYRALKLTTLADAGLAEALGNLEADRTFPGFDEYEYAGGQLETTVTALSTTRVEVIVRAKFRNRQKMISAVVRLGSGAPQVLSWDLTRVGDDEGPQDDPPSRPSRANISP